MKTIISALTFLALLAVTKVSYAKGTAGGGGGDDVRCDGGIVSLVKERFHRPILSDLFGVADPDVLESLDRWTYQSESTVQARVWSYFQQYRPDEYAQLNNTGVIFDFVEKPLESLGDGVHIPWYKRLFQKCHAHQLAIQNFRTHHVRVYRPAVEDLSQLEYVLLIIHEEKMALEATKHIPYLQMENDARDYVRGVFLDPRFQQLAIPKMLVPVAVQPNSRYVRCRGYLKDLISNETVFIDDQRLFRRIDQHETAVATMAKTKNVFVVFDSGYGNGQQMGFYTKTSGYALTRSYERDFEGVDSILLLADSPQYSANILCQPSSVAERWSR